MTPLDLFKSLADDTRLKVTLLLVTEGELCVCELMAALELSQPKVSRHLSRLRADGLLSSRRSGQWVFYRISSGCPDWVMQVLLESEKSSHTYMEQIQDKLRAQYSSPLRETCC